MSKLRYSTITGSDAQNVAEVESTTGALCTMGAREYFAWSGKVVRVFINAPDGLRAITTSDPYYIHIRTGSKRVALLDLVARADGPGVMMAVYQNPNLFSYGTKITNTATGGIGYSGVDLNKSVSMLSILYYATVVITPGTAMYSNHLATASGAANAWHPPQTHGHGPLVILKPDTEYLIGFLSAAASGSKLWGVNYELIEL